MLFFITATAAFGSDIAGRLSEIQPLMVHRIAPNPPTIPATVWDDVAAGAIVTGVEALPGQRSRKGWGVALLDVPIDRLWWGLNDELHHQELLGLGHVEVVSGAPCADGRQVMMMLPLPIVSDRWWVVENRYNTTLSDHSGQRVRELMWHDIPNPQAAALSEAARAAIVDATLVASNVGAWLLIDLNGTSTLVEYHAWSDPGGSLPAAAASAIANASIAGTIEKMAEYAQRQTLHCP